VLVQGATVRGIVVDESGQPIAGASLYIGFSVAAANRQDARSNERGEFEFAQVPFGQQKLVTQAEGYAADRKVLVFDEGEVQPDPVRIELGQGRAVSGQVVSPQGVPLSGVHLDVTHHKESLRMRIQTDEDGRFRYDFLPMTDLALAFYGERVERANVTVKDYATDELRIELNSSGYLAGRVLDATTRLAVTDFEVAFVRVKLEEGERRMSGYSGDWYPAKKFHSELGEWVYDRAEGGVVTGVTIMADGYATRFVPRVVASAEPRPELAIALLQPEHRFTGVVLGGDPLLPIPGAAISVDGQRTDGRSGYTDDYQRFPPMLTNAAGRFSIPGLSSSEDYRLRIEAVGFAKLEETPLQLSQGSAVTERQIELSRGARLRGRVLYPDGSPMAGFPVHMTLVRASSQARDRAAGVVTDGEGRFEVIGLEAGRFWIGLRSASDLGWVHHLRRRVDISTEPEQALLLQATGAVTLAGEVRYPEALPAEVSVYLSPGGIIGQRDDEEPLLGQTVFAEAGHFRFEGVQAGTYTLRATFATTGSRSTMLRQTVVVGEEDQLDLIIDELED
jgi:carboxypeptidase family protein